MPEGAEKTNRQPVHQKNNPNQPTSSTEDQTSTQAQDMGSAVEAATEIAQKVAKKTAEDVADRIAKDVIEEKLPRYTEILGVFVALFTFVSIEIQIFSRVTSLSNAVIFTFLIFLCMTGFLFILHAIINLKSEGLKETLTSVPFMGFLIIIAVDFLTISYLIRNDIPLNKQESKKIEEIKEKSIKHDSDIEYLKELI